MPPKKKEESVEGAAGRFQFADGSVYEGRYSRKVDIGTEAVLASSTGKKQTSIPSATSATAHDVIPHGSGYFYDSSSATYEGEWREGVMEGTGVFSFPSGARYVGEMSQGRFHGSGKYTWPDGSFYIGEWNKNQMHGLGVYVDRTGKPWHGSFNQGSAARLVAKIEL